MISNRRGARRSAAPVERLREFSINTSKGIDVSQSPVNSNTVAYAKNLITNPDGSLSLRKPLKHISTATARTHTLFNGDVLVCGIGGARNGYVDLKIRNPNAAAGTYYSIDVKVFDYSRNTYTYTYTTSLGSSYGDMAYECVNDLVAGASLNTLNFLNLNTVTLVAGANISINNKYGAGYFIDTKLYDSNIESVPRYLKIEKSTPTKYTITVLEPEPNTFTLAEGEPVLNPNLLLDNPYDVRDVEGDMMTMPKGILAYAWSAVNEGSATVDAIDTTATEQTLSLATPISAEFSLKIAEGVTDFEDVTIAPNSITVNTSLKAQVTDTAISFTISLPTATLKSPYQSDSVSVSGAVAIALTGRCGDSQAFSTTKSLSDSTDSATFSVSRDKFSETMVYLHLSAQVPLQMSITRNFLTDYPDALRLVHSSNLKDRYRPLNTWGGGSIALKAFGNRSKSDLVYATWLESDDGVVWRPAMFPTPSAIGMYISSTDPRVPTVWYEMWSSDWSDKKPSEFTAGTHFPNRPDVMFLVPTAAMYMFRVVTIAPDASSNVSTAIAPEVTVLSELKYSILAGKPTTVAELNFASPVYGKKLYHKKRIYSYGHEKFFNNIFVSDIDNFNTPLYNVIDLDAKMSDKVTVLTSWRDYLVSATTSAMYLHTPQANGFLTKTVTTSIGIPEEDSQCCVSILNGLVVKSSAKLYFISPNAYSGTDDVLNITPISQPVDEYLEEFENTVESSFYTKHRFAFSTEAEYVLMLATGEKTLCIRYNYTTRIWNLCEYPVHLTGYRVCTLEDIRIYAERVNSDLTRSYFEYQFDADLDVYADQISAAKHVPIEFEWDSGQKTDNISTRKQFTESKIVFATQDEAENFPMELIVAVDGDPNITRVDVRSDAPTLKTDTSVGRLNTQLRMDEDVEIPGRASNGLIRQLVVRYSGRGRSVRHVLKGIAKSPFKMYETYVRYKLIDNKR
jgi:hypothetical protein